MVFWTCEFTKSRDVVTFHFLLVWIVGSSWKLQICLINICKCYSIIFSNLDEEKHLMEYFFTTYIADRSNLDTLVVFKVVLFTYFCTLFYLLFVLLFLVKKVIKSRSKAKRRVRRPFVWLSTFQPTFHFKCCQASKFKLHHHWHHLSLNHLHYYHHFNLMSFKLFSHQKAINPAMLALRRP